MPAKLLNAEPDTLESLIPSWERSLRAANKSPKTLQAYGDAARLLKVFARDRFGVEPVMRINREIVESLIEDQLSNHRPSTAAQRYRSLQQLFKWLIEEGEITANPMANMKPPFVPPVPVPVVEDLDLRKLLEACEASLSATPFEARRDIAILRTLIDTGVRLAELGSLTVDDVDLDNEVIRITGNGRQPRAIAFGAKTANALDQYRKLRARHPRAVGTEAWWLGPKGRLTDNGIAQMLKRRCIEAGVPHIHPHQIRHTAAHVWLREGGNEGDAMRVFGWKSRRMVDRYGASAAEERAIAASRTLKLGDRL